MNRHEAVGSCLLLYRRGFAPNDDVVTHLRQQEVHEEQVAAHNEQSSKVKNRRPSERGSDEGSAHVAKSRSDDTAKGVPRHSRPRATLLLEVVDEAINVVQGWRGEETGEELKDKNTLISGESPMPKDQSTQRIQQKRYTDLRPSVGVRARSGEGGAEDVRSWGRMTREKRCRVCNQYIQDGSYQRWADGKSQHIERPTVANSADKPKVFSMPSRPVEQVKV